MKAMVRSMTSWKFKAEAVGHFASGWAWLVLKDGKLDITSLHDGDTPVAYDGMKPLLTLDVWEHAYYIDYRNARPDYVETVLKNAINWEFVAQNLDGEGVSRADQQRSEEHTYELQSLMRRLYADFRLQKKKQLKT